MMNVVVKKEIAVPAETVWSLIANFGDISWAGMKGISIEVEGEGVGMIRKISAGGGVGVERVEAFDNDAMTLTYSVRAGNPLPVNNMLCAPLVSVVDANNCQLSWTIVGTESGESIDAAEKMVNGMYSGLVNTISQAVLAAESL